MIPTILIVTTLLSLFAICSIFMCFVGMLEKLIEKKRPTPQIKEIVPEVIYETMSFDSPDHVDEIEIEEEENVALTPAEQWEEVEKFYMDTRRYV